MNTILDKMNGSTGDKKGADIQNPNPQSKPKGKDKPRFDFLPDFMNKVIICETVSGGTIAGVLIGFNQYELLLVEAKDLKSKNPNKILLFKHGLVSVR